MDAVIKKLMPPAAYMEKPVTHRPSEAEVEAAERTLQRRHGPLQAGVEAGAQVRADVDDNVRVDRASDVALAESLAHAERSA